MKKIYFDKGNEMERGKGEMMKGGRDQKRSAIREE